MIIGLGSDIIDARRIGRVIDKYGERFLNRIYTPAERAKADGRKNRVETYAKRYAAKEACAKALGTGFRRGVFWRDLGVVNLPGGKPSMQADRRCAQAPAGDHAAGLRGDHRGLAHRRGSDRAGDRHHLGGALARLGALRLKAGTAIRPTGYAAAFFVAWRGASRYKFAPGARALTGGTKGQ